MRLKSKKVMQFLHERPPLWGGNVRHYRKRMDFGEKGTWGQGGYRMSPKFTEDN